MNEEELKEAAERIREDLDYLSQGDEGGEVGAVFEG